MSLNKILFAVDSSQYSWSGIKLAAMMSKAENVPVIIVHVTAPIPTLVSDDQMRLDLDRNLHLAGENLLQDFQKELEGLGVPCSTKLVTGDAAEMIIKTAKEEKCDLIVMGARGSGAFSSLLLGSVSHKVLHLSDMPVLIAR